jgi:hypothetical protein
MNMVSSLVWSIVILSISQQASTALTHVFVLIMFIFATKRSVDSTLQIQTLDQELISHGYCSNISNRDPGVGVHFRFCPYGILICIKNKRETEYISAYSYNIYIIGPKSLVMWYDDFIERTSDGDIEVCYCTQAALYRSNFTKMREIPLGNTRKWQGPVVDTMIKDFRAHKRASCIITGDTGIGKTSIGSLISSQLKEHGLSKKPTVFFMDCTAKGFDIFSYIAPTRDTVCILMLDEYDLIVAHAEGQKDGESEGQSMAKSRSAWLGTMDRFAKTRYVIVVATTNVPIESIDSRYVRDGRFDNKFTATCNTLQ